MAGNHVEILRHLHVIDRKMQGQITESFGLPAVESQKRYGENLEPPSCLQCPQNVGGVATAGKTSNKSPEPAKASSCCAKIFSYPVSFPRQVITEGLAERECTLKAPLPPPLAP